MLFVLAHLRASVRAFGGSPLDCLHCSGESFLMLWLFQNAWSGEFAVSAILEIAKLCAAGLLIAATVWIIGLVLFRMLELLEFSR